MSDSNNNNSEQSKVVQICIILFLGIGIAVFLIASPSLLPRQRGGFDFRRPLWGAVVGAVSALIGAGIGKLIESMRK